MVTAGAWVQQPDVEYVDQTHYVDIGTPYGGIGSFSGGDENYNQAHMDTAYQQAVAKEDSSLTGATANLLVWKFDVDLVGLSSYSGYYECDLQALRWAKSGWYARREAFDPTPPTAPPGAIGYEWEGTPQNSVDGLTPAHDPVGAIISARMQTPTLTRTGNTGGPWDYQVISYRENPLTDSRWTQQYLDVNQSPDATGVPGEPRISMWVPSLAHSQGNNADGTYDPRLKTALVSVPSTGPATEQLATIDLTPHLNGADGWLVFENRIIFSQPPPQPPWDPTSASPGTAAPNQTRYYGEAGFEFPTDIIFVVRPPRFRWLYAAAIVGVPRGTGRSFIQVTGAR